MKRRTGAYMELQLPHACIYPATQAEPDSGTHTETTISKLGHHSAFNPKSNQRRLQLCKVSGQDLFFHHGKAGCHHIVGDRADILVTCPCHCIIHVGQGNISRLSLNVHGSKHGSKHGSYRVS